LKVNANEVAVSRVIEAYRQAVLIRDVDALMRLYDPGVRVFDAWNV
jgi:ketosteroid isomerase-like protein